MKKKSVTVTNRLSRLQLNYATNGKKGKRRPVAIQTSAENRLKLILPYNYLKRDDMSESTQDGSRSACYVLSCAELKQKLIGLEQNEPIIPSKHRLAISLKERHSVQKQETVSPAKSNKKRTAAVYICHTTDNIVTRQFNNKKPSINMTMHDCLIDRKKNLIMAFTPRATCTLAVSMFIHHMGLYSKAKEMSDWIHHFRGNVLERQPSYVATGKDWENPSMVKFKVVRNPYYRAVSSYTHFIRSTSSNQSFEEYLVSLLEKNPSNLSSHELTVRDYHSKPQHNKFDKSINHIVKVENIEKDLKLIDYRCKTSLYDSYLAVKNTDSHIMIKDRSITDYVGKKEGEFFRLPNREFLIPDYQYFYNETSRKLVERLYDDDIKYFNYEWPFV